VKRIYPRREVTCLRSESPEKWTCLIPAAGQGTRLNYHLPKILFPVAGKPIIDRLLQLTSAFCREHIFVVSPDAQSSVESHLRFLNYTHYKIAIQAEATGMGDAILSADGLVETKYVMIIWGDQILVSADTIRTAMQLHEARPSAKLTLPTVRRSRPYIHFERDSRERLVRVFPQREERIEVNDGENDCGIFFFEAESLFAKLRAAKQSGCYVGTKTGEFCFLPMFPEFDGENGELVTLRIEDDTEALGVNNLADAEIAESILKKRGSYVTNGNS
jgi:bifunctional N-acetylglucosamine-1-phosphate-uridyltransferase/glucosamine-1-phosphate-acetyltransferase GlmU-like protein